MLNPQDPKIIERYKMLPQPLKDALWAEETIDHIFDIGKAQHLTVSQMGELADIVGLVILGILKPEDFGSEVQRKLNLTMERASAADAIVATINEKIFAPLRQEILTVRTNADVTRTPLEAKPLTELADAEKPPVAADKTPSVKEIVVPAIPQAAGGVGEVKTIPQPASIVAKPASEPPRPSYAGRDPYREPIEGELPTSLITQPPSVAPSQPISIFAKQIPSPAPTPQSFAPPSATGGGGGQVATQAGGLASPKSDGGGPRQQQGSLAGGQVKPISWADISPEKEKASSRPDAKSALERAMNDGISPEKTNAQKYQGKAAPTGEPRPGYTGRDPYREPL